MKKKVKANQYEKEVMDDKTPPVYIHWDVLPLFAPILAEKKQAERPATKDVEPIAKK